ncbi:MAG: acyltransferase family protein [Solobacterium sp.]|nr:acyltransferase family protein [Solobacterium sp.]
MSNIIYIRYLRAFAALAIVILHTFFAYASLPTLDVAMIQKAMMFRNSMLWAVPVFVMVTGALLLDKDKEISIEKIWKKYILRIVILLVVFTLLYIAFDIYVLGKKLEVFFVIYYLQTLIEDSGWAHMWYLYMLIGIYIVLPLFKKAVAHFSKEEMAYLLIIFFFFLSVLPFIEQLYGKALGLHIPIQGIYPFYLLLGYIVHKEYIRLKVSISFIFLLVSTLGILFLTGMYPNANAYLTFSSPVVVLQAFSMYSLVKGIVKEKENRLVEWMDQGSLGVYLLHLVGIKLIFLKFNYVPNTLIGVALVALVVYLCSLGLSLVYKKL